MIFTQHYLACLSHASYLVGDVTTGRAVVVDPRACTWRKHTPESICIVVYEHADDTTPRWRRSFRPWNRLGYGGNAIHTLPIRVR